MEEGRVCSQDMLTLQHEAGVAQGRHNLSESHEGCATRADEPENSSVYYEAHAAPVNALDKIDSIRKAQGVRVIQKLSALAKFV